MKAKPHKKGQFRSKGSEILGRKKPASVEGFLNDSDRTHESESQSHKSINPHPHNPANEVVESTSQLGRLHIEARLDLVQQLMQRVYQRKCDPQLKKRATQRAIIEEALEEYFRRQPV